MEHQQGNDPGKHEPGLDPSILRGLTQPRLSRRQLLRSAGTGAGALGVGAFLAACGVKGATTSSGSTPAGGVGTAAWWAKQKLHHTVNFANWPYYIDVLKGKHPSLEHFTQTTGIQVNYTEPISDNVPFYAKIRPSLQAKQSTGFDIIVMTNNSPPLGYLIKFGWLTPLDRSMMTNFDKYAGPLIKNPSWDPGNKYTMAWQSGWTAIGYNSSVIKNPGTSVGILFDKKHAGKVGMMNDPQELGSVGLLAIGVDPAGSTESEWAKAAKKLQQQKSDGIVRAYYDQELHRPPEERRHGRQPGVVRRHLPGRPEQQVPRPQAAHPERGRHVLDGQHVHSHVCPESQGRHDAHGLLLRPAVPGRGGVLRRLRLPGASRQAGPAQPDRMGQDRR